MEIFKKKKYFDPIEDYLSEWEEHIYAGYNTEEVLERVRGNKEYINLALAVRMFKSSKKIETLTKWIMGLTFAMILLGIIQLSFLL